MEMSYSADVDHIDEPIEAAAAERREGEPLRIRLQPSIFRRGVGQHRMWPGVSWTVDCKDVAEAVALREGLRAFFEAMVREGPARIIETLDQMNVA